MDVVVQSECPGTDLYAAFNEKKEAQVRRLEAQKKVVAELVGELDKAMADTLKGATTRDRINALMDAAIKKLDASYGASNIVAEKKERYERAKSRYQEASQELAKIDEEIKKAAGSVSRSFNSKIGKIAKMPLFGSSCLEQAESWDSKTETYSVAVAMVWSVGLEKATRAIVQGQEIILDAPKKDKLTVQAWLEKQDLSFMNGPRTYMDGKGERYFLGVAARPIVAQASRREKNRDMARLQADGMAVLSLRADVEVAKLAEQMAQTITVSDAKEDEMALESFSKKVSAKLVGQNVSGLASAFYEKEIQHGTTGIKTLVTVSCISPQSVKAARTMEEINYAAAIAGNKENARMQGRKDAMQAEEKAARNDPGSYRKGAQEGSEALKKQEVTRQAQQQKNLQKQAKTPPEKNTTRTSTVNGAVSSGKGKIDDDFE
jgi:hypothetical protein